MFTYKPYLRILFAFAMMSALVSCGGDRTADTAGEYAAEAQAAGGAFDDVAAKMDGASVAESRRLLMDNYARVSDPNTGRVAPRASRQYILLAERLADEAEGDTLAALPLYRAAEVYQALGDYQGAAKIFRRIHDDYPDFSKSGEALFMLAFTYDENLQDYDTARRLYNQFLAEHPNHTFADDTEMLLKNLGKSDEEMLKGLGAEL